MNTQFTDTKRLSQWNLALKRIAESRRQEEKVIGSRFTKGSLNAALHTPVQPNVIGNDPLASNIADMMRPESTVLDEYGLKSDFTFTPLAEQRDNTVMQLCAWDDSIPGSAVSGCINLRSTFNVNTQIESRDIITPLSVFALNRPRFETLRAAVAEQPTLEATMQAVCDVFDNNSSVKFTPLEKCGD
jgi:hypothetical protein